MSSRLAVALVCLVSACDSAPPRSPANEVKTRAAADFGCPAGDIKTNTIDERTRVATGCGQSGTYVETCEACVTGYGAARNVEPCRCTWVLDHKRPSR